MIACLLLIVTNRLCRCLITKCDKCVKTTFIKIRECQNGMYFVLSQKRLQRFDHISKVVGCPLTKGDPEGRLPRSKVLFSKPHWWNWNKNPHQLVSGPLQSIRGPHDVKYFLNGMTGDWGKGGPKKWNFVNSLEV